jgi:uncharacterized membrane protein YhaH (DUF805 family)
MRLAAFVVCIVAALTGTAAAGEIWKYRDPASPRDVFVNKLDQVPAELRAEAQLMVSDGLLVNSTPPSGGGVPAAPGGTVVFGDKVPSDATEAFKSAVHKAVEKDLSLRNVTGAAVMAMDTALVRAGKPPITPAETSRLSRLMLVIAVALSVAGLVSFVIWIVLMVHAWREGHPGWSILIFLVHLLGVFYAFLHVERRWLRWVSLLCYLAPVLVGVAAAWQIRSWFMDLGSARG